MPSDVEGYFDRECPSPECRAGFRVREADWRDKVRDEEVFCPLCGHSADSQHWLTQEQADRVKEAAVAHLQDRMDTADHTARRLNENGLQNSVTAFQRYAEALFSRHPSPPAARRNVFQNLVDGSDLWRAAFGKQYSDHLQPGELATLTRVFQQRHVLAHREGLVDQDYLERSGDTTYRAGQRLIVRESAVRECLALIEKLAAGMASDVADAGV